MSHRAFSEKHGGKADLPEDHLSLVRPGETIAEVSSVVPGNEALSGSELPCGILRAEVAIAFVADVDRTFLPRS